MRRELGISLKSPNEEVFASGLFDSVEYVVVRPESPKEEYYAEFSDITDEFVRLSGKYGVKINSFHLPFATSEFFNFQPSALRDDLREDTLENTKRLIDIFRKTGMKTVVIHGSMRVVPEELSARVEAFIDYLKKLCDFCAPLGIKVAVEDLMPGWIGSTAEEMLHIMESVGRENLGICYDSNHFLGSDNEGFVRAVGKYILTTHISDYDGEWERHWFPGRGVIDWKRITRALDDVGYDGPILFEVGFGGKEPTEHDCRELVDCWKKAIV